jgi:hypothetical protein
MVVESTRTFNRRQCRGEVLVYDLGGGETLKGELTDLGTGGARLILDRPLAAGRVVRLVFPRSKHSASRTGKMIVGQVVHSRSEAGQSVVGVAFGWDAAVKESPRLAGPKKISRWWSGLFSRNTNQPPTTVSRKG